MTGLPPLVQRMQAVEATERHFAGKAFALGKVDCARVAAFHLKRFGWKLPKIAAYRTEIQAAAALKALDAKTIADVIDAIGLQQISPASALLGDLYFMPGNGPSGTVAISLGNGAMKGFHEDHDGLVTMRSDMIVTAWNVLP
jgi:hypothetical protein